MINKTYKIFSQVSLFCSCLLFQNIFKAKTKATLSSGFGILVVSQSIKQYFYSKTHSVVCGAGLSHPTSRDGAQVRSQLFRYAQHCFSPQTTGKTKRPSSDGLFALAPSRVIQTNQFQWYRQSQPRLAFSLLFWVCVCLYLHYFGINHLKYDKKVYLFISQVYLLLFYKTAYLSSFFALSTYE